MAKMCKTVVLHISQRGTHCLVTSESLFCLFALSKEGDNISEYISDEWIFIG
jgi:hypothetical protein